MRRLWLYAIVIASALYGTAAAQGTALVEYDDRDDPCRRFKMRVLVPADLPADSPRVKKPAADVDPGMVRDPCRQDEPQLASAPPAPRPPERGGSLPPPAFRLRFPFEEGGRRGPSGPLPSELAPGFKYMRRRH